MSDGNGRFFRELRKSRGMTQAYMAELLNVSPQAVSKWEREECLPDIMLLPDIASLFGVKIEELLAGGFDAPHSQRVYLDDATFSKAMEEFALIESADMVSLDAFPFLSNKQKEMLLDTLLSKENYRYVIDDIIGYTNNSQRSRILKVVLNNSDYEALALLIPFTTSDMRTRIMEELLSKKEFELIEEELLPFLNRQQKSSLIEAVLRSCEPATILENYMPFFDLSQRKRLEYIWEEL